MKDKSKKLLIWVLIGIAITILLITLSIFLFATIYTKLTTPPKEVNTKNESIRTEEQETKIDELYIINCNQKTPKPYNGYVIGDTIDCTVRFNTSLKDFEDVDTALKEIEMTVNTSKSLSLNEIKVTGPYNNKLDEEFATTIKGNKVKITNTTEYGMRDGKYYCDIKYPACEFYYHSKGKAKIAAYNYEFNNDSIKAVEIHLEFNVLYNLSDNNNIEINVDDTTTKFYHFKDYSLKPYKSDIKYSYDIKNNDKYYVENKNIYKLEDNNKYKYLSMITCKEYKCNVYNKDTLYLGYVIIREDTGKQDSTYNRIWDIEKKEEYKTYKALYTLRDEDKVYLIGNQENNLNTFTIIRLNDKQELNSFTVSDSSKIYNITTKDNKIIVTMANKETLEFNI